MFITCQLTSLLRLIFTCPTAKFTIEPGIFPALVTVVLRNKAVDKMKYCLKVYIMDFKFSNTLGLVLKSCKQKPIRSSSVQNCLAPCKHKLNEVK